MCVSILSFQQRRIEEDRTNTYGVTILFFGVTESLTSIDHPAYRKLPQAHFLSVYEFPRETFLGVLREEAVTPEQSFIGVQKYLLRPSNNAAFIANALRNLYH